MGTSVILFDLIFKPGQVMDKIATYRPVIRAILIIMFASYLSLLTNLLTSPAPIRGIFLPALFGLSTAFFRIVLVLIFSLFLFLVSKIFKGQGNFLGLLSALGFVHVVFIFMPIVELIGIFQGPFEFISLWMKTAIYLWFLFLVVLAIRESQDFNSGRAVISFVLTLLIILLLGASISFSLLFMIF
ncbi:YIP1 family protein [Halarsenatibacter silvermanii]|uniref:Yip1 domain-containing protein n=1 Tax=Halarsenatibacter silvermanii TaxID=321763 RepID=A0A1G9KKT3_9FIRM|nr:YIP1 family protein [Halarsenatibacter silvermanii]SDL50331.1 Yip1 domain-containing protein [Halarsenatibacter silvermanii]